MKHERRKVTIPELLYTLLDLAGIKCTENPSLYTWRYQLGVERQIKIDSFEQFIKNFTIGVYQIYVINPEMSGFGSDKFKIKSLSITIAYEGEGQWGTPEIQTEEEEISPDDAVDFMTKATQRANKIGLKVKDAITVLSLFFQASEVADSFSGQ